MTNTTMRCGRFRGRTLEGGRAADTTATGTAISNGAATAGPSRAGGGNHAPAENTEGH